MPDINSVMSSGGVKTQELLSERKTVEIPRAQPKYRAMKISFMLQLHVPSLNYALPVDENRLGNFNNSSK